MRRDGDRPRVRWPEFRLGFVQLGTICPRGTLLPQTASAAVGPLTTTALAGEQVHCDLVVPKVERGEIKVDRQGPTIGGALLSIVHRAPT